jgi:O-acetyl-ADP-ribose deacetylase (regulator of RNase III)
MHVTVNGCLVQLHQGDITQQEVDAIVNAANSRLAGGGGVDGAIHRRGGPSIMEDTRRRYPLGCPTGSAVASTAGELSARLVIHAVGPVWHGGLQGERDLLCGAIRSSLTVAVAHRCRSIALPALSTGAYGYPIDQAAEAMLETIQQFLQEHGQPADVRLVLFGDDATAAFSTALAQLARSAV